MNIYVNKVSTNKSTINSPQGFSLPVIICNAFEIDQLQEDLILMDQENERVSFLPIPLTEGTIKVELASGMIYTISEAEVSASIGYPMVYLCKKIFKEGTTATLNIGL